MSERIEITIVVPMDNEEEVIGLFFDRVVRVLSSVTDAYEIISVNDGSSDPSLELLLQARKDNPKIKILNLSRNFGKEAALTAGIEHAGGQAVIVVDADLQDQPELIPELVAKWREGYDVVATVRADRGSDRFWKRFTARVFYRFMGRLSEVAVTPNAGDFRLLDRRVVDALGRFPERTRFMKGIFAWLGFRQAFISHVRAPRAAGTTKWPYWKLWKKLWNFALDGITSFTSLPLRIWTYVGVLMALLAFIYALYIAGRPVIYGVDLPGYASIIVILLFFNGLNLLSIGILGEYLARIFIEVKRRPLYLVRDHYGFAESLDGGGKGSCHEIA